MQVYDAHIRPLHVCLFVDQYTRATVSFIKNPPFKAHTPTNLFAS